MKALHIASFNGNVGDIANHLGFRRCMQLYSNRIIKYTNLEMREFYQSWGLRKFDHNFIEYANQFDLIIFGGGNFFEMCWDYSATGTTIDISHDLLEKIKPPILFNGLGIDDKNGTINHDNIGKFGRFLKILTESDKYFVSVRNDGSRKIAESYYSPEITQYMIKIPDGGFFVNPKQYKHIEIPKDYNVISVNLAGDSIDKRFSHDGLDGRITNDQFIEEFSNYVNNLLAENQKIYIVFVPHIVKDYEIFTKVFASIKDIYLRTRISVAPCVNGTVTEGEYIVDIYRNSILTLGMRYHANVCSMAVNTPSIGIVNLMKHKKLFEDIGMADRIIESDKPELCSRLTAKTNEFLEHIEQKRNENLILLERLNKENKKYFNKVSDWFTINRL